MHDAVRAAGVVGMLVSAGIGIFDVVLSVGARPIARPGFDAMRSVRILKDPSYRCTARNRRAFAITDTELSDIASAAMVGLRRIPNAGYSTPAAMGIPITL